MQDDMTILRDLRVGECFLNNAGTWLVIDKVRRHVYAVNSTGIQVKIREARSVSRIPQVDFLREEELWREIDYESTK